MEQEDKSNKIFNNKLFWISMGTIAAAGLVGYLLKNKAREKTEFNAKELEALLKPVEGLLNLFTPEIVKKKEEVLQKALKYDWTKLNPLKKERHLLYTFPFILLPQPSVLDVKQTLEYIQLFLEKVEKFYMKKLSREEREKVVSLLMLLSGEIGSRLMHQGIKEKERLLEMSDRIWSLFTSVTINYPQIVQIFQVKMIYSRALVFLRNEKWNLIQEQIAPLVFSSQELLQRVYEDEASVALMNTFRFALVKTLTEETRESLNQMDDDLNLFFALKPVKNFNFPVGEYDISVVSLSSWIDSEGFFSTIKFSFSSNSNPIDCVLEVYDPKENKLLHTEKVKRKEIPELIAKKTRFITPSQFEELTGEKKIESRSEESANIYVHPSYEAQTFFLAVESGKMSLKSGINYMFVFKDGEKEVGQLVLQSLSNTFRQEKLFEAMKQLGYITKERRELDEFFWSVHSKLGEFLSIGDYSKIRDFVEKVGVKRICELQIDTRMPLAFISFQEIHLQTLASEGKYDEIKKRMEKTQNYLTYFLSAFLKKSIPIHALQAAQINLHISAISFFSINEDFVELLKFLKSISQQRMYIEPNQTTQNILENIYASLILLSAAEASVKASSQYLNKFLKMMEHIVEESFLPQIEKSKNCAKFSFAEVLLFAGKLDEAMDLLEKLDGNIPNNTLYHLLLSFHFEVREKREDLKRWVESKLALLCKGIEENINLALKKEEMSLNGACDTVLHISMLSHLKEFLGERQIALNHLSTMKEVMEKKGMKESNEENFLIVSERNYLFERKGDYKYADLCMSFYAPYKSFSCWKTYLQPHDTVSFIVVPFSDINLLQRETEELEKLSSSENSSITFFSIKFESEHLQTRKTRYERLVQVNQPIKVKEGDQFYAIRADVFCNQTKKKLFTSYFVSGIKEDPAEHIKAINQHDWDGLWEEYKKKMI